MAYFFFLVTDAMSLKWLVTMKSTSKLFMRWSTHIFSFNFKVLQRRGKIHLNGDVLSRNEDILDKPSESDVSDTNIHTLASINTLCGIPDYNFLDKISECDNSNCKICVIKNSYIPFSDKDKFNTLKSL